MNEFPVGLVVALVFIAVGLVGFVRLIILDLKMSECERKIHDT